MTGWYWRLTRMLAMLAVLVLAGCPGAMYAPAPEAEIGAVGGGSDSGGGGGGSSM